MRRKSLWIRNEARSFAADLGEAFDGPTDSELVQLVLLPTFHPDVVITLLTNGDGAVLSLASKGPHDETRIESIGIGAVDAAALVSAARRAVDSVDEDEDGVSRDGMAVYLRVGPLGEGRERGWHPEPMPGSDARVVIDHAAIQLAGITDDHLQGTLAAALRYLAR